MRRERDSLGEVEVADDAFWGAQTQRSLHFFAIGEERMPLPIIHALAQIKAAAARVNGKLGLLAANLVEPIAQAADEVAAGQWDAQFPLRVWQTGSGTQSNMNVNEVIANLANECLGAARGSKNPVHPNDHVNLGQSSNDVFPSALHLSVASAVHAQLLPALQCLRDLLQQRSQDFADILKIGRTHLMDAVPMRLGQEFSGYVDQLRQGEAGIRSVLPGLYALALGGTAVGTGLNTHPDFALQVCRMLTERLSLPLRPAENAFAALAGQEALCQLSGQLRSLAMSLLKIANDIRWMGSGPRAGLGELALPENEPGSSIMPGKVNPTQAEALSMVCAQVFGNDATVAFAASQGNFELNVYKPVIGYNVLQSITLLADAMRSFTLHCVQGLQARADRLQVHLDSSLMLVTALVPSLGYERAAKIAQRAHQEGSTLRAAALASGWIDAAQLDEILRPERMLAPDRN
ncbi:class II fumarate hydratase [Acidithiobacillus sp. CV18-2]|uniref:Fumarate hydratase class II n=1 Tax=Igneacidithiobacillus copahuensis TaxID=2724909 RepID=A0AAE2YMS7_9PROT|nr:class II fumarate hydratase [Igneacidithiobacillus copahuensis]MBU2753731.1 class II fumarate hydratase [Acidithiobacillus sp. CV18-3]MBU2758277.1 class II fumarate hydratase [Acidithiobacillus sp. BN09-2]MBU2778070.1 class II fumarate hydratase [Acidithiobacillus sp. CV18-2]MBU2796040.1 class II fumarate hydratase [Acidithiobacillus sp. VAN18-2]MBU2798037.1 class II fumarate hydratase [Acidithiobacillus sp. VAN18-4]UTV80311.1 class II fumarate hydratase [Acidithiobacillus sp. YTS05]